MVRTAFLSFLSIANFAFNSRGLHKLTMRAWLGRLSAVGYLHSQIRLDLIPAQSFNVQRREYSSSLLPGVANRMQKETPDTLSPVVGGSSPPLLSPTSSGSARSAPVSPNLSDYCDTYLCIYLLLLHLRLLLSLFHPMRLSGSLHLPHLPPCLRQHSSSHYRTGIIVLKSVVGSLMLLLG